MSKSRGDEKSLAYDLQGTGDAQLLTDGDSRKKAVDGFRKKDPGCTVQFLSRFGEIELKHSFIKSICFFLKVFFFYQRLDKSACRTLLDSKLLVQVFKVQGPFLTDEIKDDELGKGDAARFGGLFLK